MKSLFLIFNKCCLSNIFQSIIAILITSEFKHAPNYLTGWQCCIFISDKLPDIDLTLFLLSS